MSAAIPVFTHAPWAELIFQEFITGIKEWPDPGENTRILEYFRVGCPGFTPPNGDETNWCAAAIRWALVTSRVPNATGKPLARSLLTVGEAIQTPKPGCVVVMWRGSKTSWEGHVGIWVGQFGENNLVLGANQSNAITVAPFPKNRVLGYRWFRAPFH
jgi:uncharacterized protein (TIGR02594 family)